MKALIIISTILLVSIVIIYVLHTVKKTIKYLENKMNNDKFN
jgi:uncharacterized protein YoxC